jgi:hypothetical protein
MKLIIDIPEEEVNECKRQVDMIKQEGFLIESLNTALKIHVANGTPLPKGHGRLVDVKEVIKIANKTKDLHGAIWNAPTIIEADKEDIKNV